jgi:hypothetical protein
MAFITTIIARILAITDSVLAIYTTTPVELQGASACTAGAINVCVNACGADLVTELQNLTFGGVSFLNGILTAFGAGCY